MENQQSKRILAFIEAGQLLCWSVVLLAATSMLGYAEIYTWKDEDGRTQFSDSKPVDTDAKEITVDPDSNTYSSPVNLPKFKYTPKTKAKTKRSVKRGEVVMYSTEWCGYCGRARDYFKKKGIPYKEYDIEKSKKAKMEHASLGSGGVPVFLIGTKSGTKKVNGFSEKRFEAVYN